MQITFLVGNGFDRNLGLDTTYSNFVFHYKKIKPKTPTLEKFHAYIKENEDLWSAAEIAMGKYTDEFEAGSAVAFSECHTDFCEQLAVYLKDQMTRIDYDDLKEAILKAFAKLNQLSQIFPAQERDILDAIYRNRVGEEIVFNFICFNYTDTLDQCLSLIKANPDTLGRHRNGGQLLNHSVGQICHVHGTVEKEMVFGVNDESQIAKSDIFECEDGDIYKNMLIKIQANASFLENTDARAAKLIQNSHLIYVYGMSIGATDTLWWNRICEWLAKSSEHHLIVQKYSMPAKSVIPIDYQLAERKARREITQYAALGSDRKVSIEARIHITGDNIFGDISKIAKAVEDKNYLTVLEQIQTEEKELSLV